MIGSERTEAVAARQLDRPRQAAQADRAVVLLKRPEAPLPARPGLRLPREHELLGNDQRQGHLCFRRGGHQDDAVWKNCAFVLARGELLAR